VWHRSIPGRAQDRPQQTARRNDPWRRPGEENDTDETGLRPPSKRRTGTAQNNAVGEQVAASLDVETVIHGDNLPLPYRVVPPASSGSMSRSGQTGPRRRRPSTIPACLSQGPRYASGVSPDGFSFPAEAARASSSATRWSRRSCRRRSSSAPRAAFSRRSPRGTQKRQIAHSSPPAMAP